MKTTTDHTPSISILTPVYKTERFLRTCLGSIVRQTFTDWELVVVDDASPDGSGAILAEFASRDPRIKIVTHPVNRGLSQARFTGLKHATGRYVMFVDSDDWIPRGALRALYDKIEADGADMVIGAAVKTFGRHSLIKTRPSNNYVSREPLTESISVPELMDKYYLNYFGINYFSATLWGKIYRRSAIDKAPLEPVPFFMGEDLVFNLILHPYLTKIGFVTDIVYCYRWGGGTSSSIPNFLNTSKYVHRLREKQIQKYDYRVARPYLKIELINCFYSHFRNLVMLDGMSYDEVAKRVADELKDDIYGAELFEGIEMTERASALRSRDIDAIIAIVKGEVRKIAPRHRVVKLISRLIA
jgi:glycosyltransferase involved in cell wall biosynthesis